MAGVNKAIIVGNLGRDPEMRYMPNGTAVANLNIATSFQWNDKNTGEKRERTEWHRVVVFGRQAEVCGQYLSKGKQVYIEGRIQTREWEDKDGNRRWTTEIVAQTMQMLGSRSDSSGSGGPPGEYPDYYMQGGPQENEDFEGGPSSGQAEKTNQSSGYQGPGGPSSGGSSDKGSEISEGGGQEPVEDDDIPF